MWLNLVVVVSIYEHPWWAPQKLLEGYLAPTGTVVVAPGLCSMLLSHHMHHHSLCVLFCYRHREAEVFKEQGNAYYVKKDYSEAFNYYTKAIGEFACLSCTRSLPLTLTLTLSRSFSLAQSLSFLLLFWLFPLITFSPCVCRSPGLNANGKAWPQGDGWTWIKDQKGLMGLDGYWSDIKGLTCVSQKNYTDSSLFISTIILYREDEPALRVTQTHTLHNVRRTEMPALNWRDLQ